MPTLFLLAGYALMVTGVALWSIPVACIVGGALMFIAGGLAARQPSREQE